MTDYASVEDVREALQLTGDAYDAELARLVSTASRLIDAICKRPDGFVAAAAPSARVFDGRGKAALAIPECVSVATVETRNASEAAWTALAEDEYCLASGSAERPSYHAPPFTLIILNARAASPTISVFPAGAQTVRVTARWGYASEVPDTVRQAAIMQAAIWFKRGQQAYNDASANADLGQLLYTKRLDPGIEALLYDGGLVRVEV